MKAFYSEAYYRDQQDRFLKQYKKTADLEHDLDLLMKGIDETVIPAQAIKSVRQVYAKKVYDTCKAWCIERMQMIQRIERGEASLGYTNQSQEIHAMHDIRQEFEFTCLMLADFRKKYKIA